MTEPVKKQNYLNNKDILKEIHKSKMSYCYVENPKYDQYDIILDDVSEINADTLQKAKENRAARIQSEDYAVAMEQHDQKDYRNKPKQKDFAVDTATLADDDVVFRVMTYEHVPDDLDRKKSHKLEQDSKSKVNFPPFKHYAYQAGILTEVARSHWTGDLITGEFDPNSGRLTNKLGQMFIKLVERYSHRSNWRGYTYVDEMRGQALLQLSFVALKFNEAKSDNPFAYYTAAVNNSFTGVLNSEKRNQGIRDDILIEQGHLPSYSRQIAHEEEIRHLREASESESSALSTYDDY
jgi:hypothetical protein